VAVGSVGGGTSGYSPISGGFAPASVTTGGGATPDQGKYGEGKGYWTHAQYKRAYSDYLTSKGNEIAEQQEAREYRHGKQWTAGQIETFNKRKQPVVTFNRVGRKIDGIVGLVESLRREPKAIPRTPRFQAGADLATAAVRSALERGKWKAKSPKCAETAAVDGIGGIELMLEQNSDGSWEIDFEEVDIAGFFYDPRSRKENFSDAIYMGMGKWIDSEVLIDKMPDKAELIRMSVSRGWELTSNSSAEANWFMSSGQLKSVRLVYICYQHKGRWCYALFTGAAVLMEGESNFVDRNGKSVCSFLMFSAAVDHDNDRYGFPRNLKSPQDEINQRRSKGLHELNTRRLIAEKGAFDNIELTRQEAVKPDGIIERNKGYDAEFDDAKKQQDIAGQLQFLQDAKQEIENFGPNASLMGSQGITNRSGRAIALMQQQGLAELGPYLIAHQNWKQRVYETVFFGIKKYWTNARWVRVTDDDGAQQLIGINQLQLDQMGQPVIVNSIGELDVDIVIDEGPDTVTMMEDLYETLSQIIPAIAPMLSPPEVQAVVGMLIETSPMSATAKRKFQMASQQSQQPNPMAQQAQMLQLQGADATVKKLQSEATLNMAKAQKELMPEPQQAQQQKFELPPAIQIGQAVSQINKTNADAVHKRALAQGEQHYTAVHGPFDYATRAMQAIMTHHAAVSDRLMAAQQHGDEMIMRQRELDAQPRPAFGG